MRKRLILGALLGGIAIFVGGSITHILLPIGDKGLQSIPKEFAVIDTLKATLPGPGVYLYPAMDGVNMNDKVAVAAYEEKTKNTPHGLVVMAAPSGGLVPPGKLAIQLAGDLLAASVGAVLLGLAGLNGYWRRVAFIAALGLFSGFLINIPQWNWLGFSATYLVSDMFDHVVRSVFGGLAMAWVVKT